MNTIIKADLHLHSFYSDGKFSIPEIIKLLKENEISIFSITDHDVMEGTREAMELCKENGMTTIPGIEFSTSLNNREVHILGYWLDYASTMLEEYLKGIHQARHTRFLEMLERLNKIGCKISFDDVKKIFPEDVPLGRPHLAKMLVSAGYAATMQEAFYKYIGDNKIADVKKKNPQAGEVIELIHELGGVAFLAHPGKHFLWEDIDLLLDIPIDGIEVIHPTHSKSKSDFLNQFADEKNLMKSGGSDFHGIFDKDIQNLGKYFIEENEIQSILYL